MDTPFFDHIRGQHKAKALLARALASNRLSHGYLFSGPDGVGKTTMAMAFAAQMFCTGDSVAGPCGQCGGCIKFRSSNHPDFIRIAPQGAAIKIDQIRALKEALVYAPFEKGYRVVVLEEVHTMRREAGNSLLKLLEEPPPGNLFLLLASSAEALLPTIVSRCQVIPFFPLSPDAATAVIVAHQPELGEEHARLLAALADGCPGQALILETEGVLTLYSEVLEQMVRRYPSEAERVEGALGIAAEMGALKEPLPVLLQLFRLFFKDVMKAVAGVVPQAAQSAPVAAARELWNLDQLSAKIAAVDLAEKALARNCNRGLVCEVLMLEIIGYPQ